MTISNELEYENTKRMLTLAERALKSLQRDLLPDSPDEYAAFVGAYLNRVRKLRAEIDGYLGVQQAEEQAMPLWVRIQGPDIDDKAPMTVVFEFLRDFRYGILQIAKLNAKSVLGRVAKDSEIGRLTDARVRIMPGSLRIGLSPPPTQTYLEGKQEDLTKLAMVKLLDGVLWSTRSGTRNELARHFPDPVERQLILRNVERLSNMRGGEVTKIVFNGKLTKGRHYTLTKKSSPLIRAAMKRELPPELTRFEGVVRKIDLDRREFLLRRKSAEKEEKRHCIYGQELEEEVKSALDKRVRVIGEARGATGTPIKVRLIEFVENR